MIRVVIQDENGNQVTDGVDVPTNLLTAPDDPRFSCLRFVDPYGDTVFNRLQAAALLQDLRLVRQTCDTEEQDGAIRQIEELVERCKTEPHLYVKLIGD